MKVTETFSSSSNVASLPQKEGSKAAAIQDTGFLSHISKIENKSFEDRINNLVQRIFEQGERLAKRTDIKELKSYKKLISQFLDEAINTSQKFSKQSLLDRRGRHRVYAVIKKINNQVEELTDEVLKEEKDNLKILQKLEDIRGLVLDLMI